MQIRIRLITMMRIRIRIHILGSKKGSNPWKNAKIGSYSKHFCLTSANWCRSGSGSRLGSGCGSTTLVTILRVKQMRILYHNSTG
jgi:hypothetical protein